jgi:signal transduction histidine kinase
VALGIVALGRPDRAGLPGLDVAVFAVLVAWSLTAVTARLRCDAPLLGRLVGVGALLGAAALWADRLARSSAGAEHSAARVVLASAVPLLVALTVHVLLALPDGQLAGRGRQVTAAGAYGAAVVVAGSLAAGGVTPAVWAAVVVWAFGVGSVLPAVLRRYTASGGHARERMQWLAVGVIGSGTISLAACVLEVLVRWPGRADVVAVASTLLIPAAVLVSQVPALAQRADRLLVHVLSVGGFAVVVSVIYLVVVLGLGGRPSGQADRQVLGLSMVAAAIAAIGYVPARDRLIRASTNLVYGAKEAPDEVLRTFGSRLTRAITMDELLLQLVESLRKTMALTSAEVYSGAGDVLERTVSVPDRGPGSLVMTERERPVLARAGVSGNAWAAVWLPTLLDDRAGHQVRIAPISHGGELLGLIVVERPVDSDTFTEEDDRVLTELARQVGLAFHNVQLDAALQTTLDEVRKQADELRASRARIVASGDAERRRVERNLHDGAQQHLVALAVNLRLTRDVVVEDPTGALEMLDLLAESVQQTIQELRELAHGIYPPLLVDSGLGEALRAACNRSPLDVGLTCEGIGRYPAEMEAAVYFCCLEALQNAAKHAPGATVEVRVWEDAGGILFSVRDDGPGFEPEAARRGHGFVNMADRLGAFGGTVRWESEVGAGSIIRGSMPLP